MSKKSTRNKNAGKSTGTSKSAKYLATHPEARKKKAEYDKKFHATPERKAYRVSLNKANREAGTVGKMTKMGKDMSHGKDGTIKPESRKKNRARNGKGNNKRLR